MGYNDETWFVGSDGHKYYPCGLLSPKAHHKYYPCDLSSLNAHI